MSHIITVDTDQIAHPAQQLPTAQGAQGPAGYQVAPAAAVRQSSSHATTSRVWPWAFISCALLLIGGLGPQCHTSTINLGELGSATVTTAYVVSGTVYAVAALVVGACLVARAKSPAAGRWTLSLAAFAAMSAMLAAMFSLLEISEIGQIGLMTAGWGLYLALVASGSTAAAVGVLARRAKRAEAQRTYRGAPAV